jgi:AcrR family transcriptional regulator
MSIITNILFLSSKRCFDDKKGGKMKKIVGVREKILKYAKKEFLDKGFNNASVRAIAKAANTATGSIYSRFGDKEAIFNAIVMPIVDELEDWFISEQEKYLNSDKNKEWNEMKSYTHTRQVEMLEYIYNHFDIFKLLIQCSQGTEYNNFVQRLSDIHTEYTLKYLDHKNSNTRASAGVSKRLIHMLNSAQYSAIFEIVIYDIPFEEAKNYMIQIEDFFKDGWERLLC